MMYGLVQLMKTLYSREQRNYGDKFNYKDRPPFRPNHVNSTKKLLRGLYLEVLKMRCLELLGLVLERRMRRLYVDSKNCNTNGRTMKILDPDNMNKIG